MGGAWGFGRAGQTVPAPKSAPSRCRGSPLGCDNNHVAISQRLQAKAVAEEWTSDSNTSKDRAEGKIQADTQCSTHHDTAALRQRRAVCVGHKARVVLLEEGVEGHVGAALRAHREPSPLLAAQARRILPLANGRVPTRTLRISAEGERV